LPVALLKNDNIEQLINISKNDWDSFEFSWNFRASPFIINSTDQNELSSIFNIMMNVNLKSIQKVNKLEEENNALFIHEYALHSKLESKTPIEEITLTVNPKYRYGTKQTDQELADRFQSDTLTELISYAIGCMMGRYSLDREGLVYAHSSNEGFLELEAEGAYKTFLADDDAIIPLTDETWFDDDATNRFKEFLLAVWGQNTLEENLQFVADSLCLYALKPKKNESTLETIRRYFTTGFYKQHLKTYKKRPIYWLFSSGKQKAFECLVYLHRYNEATLSRMRTEYVTPLLGKFEAQQRHMNDQINNASSTAEANKHKKALTILEKKQSELREFDDKLKHYADMQITLDLDDGVKVNYGKFGDLLANVKEVTGKKPK